MARHASRPRQVSRFLYWTPRILSILFICFLVLFSFDVITPETTFWQIVLGMLIHNIPVFILTAILIISWKYEIVGGIAFILAGLVYMGFMVGNAISNPFQWYMLSYNFIVAGPAFLIGILFLIGWHRKGKMRKKVMLEAGASSLIILLLVIILVYRNNMMHGAYIFDEVSATTYPLEMPIDRPTEAVQYAKDLNLFNATLLQSAKSETSSLEGWDVSAERSGMLWTVTVMSVGVVPSYSCNYAFTIDGNPVQDDYVANACGWNK